jgi:hypothetical protein
VFKVFVISLVLSICFPAIAFSDTPKVMSSKFIDGTYTDNKSVTCTLETSELNDGRVEAALTCLSSKDHNLSATWATGRISGHPFELDLKTAGIEKIPGYANYSWGKVSNAYNAFGGCFQTNQIFGVRQVRKTLSLTNYGAKNTAMCGVNLTRRV